MKKLKLHRETLCNLEHATGGVFITLVCDTILTCGDYSACRGVSNCICSQMVYACYKPHHK
jgi:hypothetical protein